VFCVFCIALSWMNITSYKEEFDEKLVDLKMSLKTMKNSQNFISLSNKYLPTKLEKYPSYFHLQKTSVEPQFTYSFIQSVSQSVVCLTTMHRIFLSKFSTECDLVLPVSISSTLFSLVIQYVRTSSSSSSRHFYPSLYLSFHTVC
jgi:hypothetical protein